MQSAVKTGGKLKLFIDNFVVYGLGGIINSIIPFAMIPIITRILPNTEYYGLNDLTNTLVQFSMPLGVLGLYDAMYRMYFERDNELYRKEICTTSLAITLLSGIFISIIMLIFNKCIASLFFGDKKYYYLVYIAAVSVMFGTPGNIIAAPIRMQNKRKQYIITHAVAPLLSYSMGLVFIVNGYYLMGLPIATLLSSFIMFITYIIINKKWFGLRYINFAHLKQLLYIGLPLVPNFLIYWVFNSCDKLMITNILSVGEAGIYSVGSKLGHASQLIYTAFAGGWQYFAFSTMKEKDQVSSNSIIFEYLGILSFVATSFICAWSNVIFKILFPEKYISGYITAPYLFFAPLLQMLFQVASNQFLVVKKTWPNFFILSLGAGLNIVLNLLLIPVLGIEGASIATLMGYVTSVIICMIVLIKMNLMYISKRFILAALLVCIFMISWRLLYSDKIIIGTIICVMFSGILTILYSDDIKRFINLIAK